MLRKAKSRVCYAITHAYYAIVLLLVGPMLGSGTVAYLVNATPKPIWYVAAWGVAAFICFAFLGVLIQWVALYIYAPWGMRKERRTEILARWRSQYSYLEEGHPAQRGRGFKARVNNELRARNETFRVSKMSGPVLVFEDKDPATAWLYDEQHPEAARSSDPMLG